MKKTIMSLSLACMVLFAAACSSNKEKAADSDSIVTVETEEVDSTLVDTVEAAPVVEEPAPEATKPANNTRADKPKGNNKKQDPKKEEPKVANEEAKAGLNAAIKQTKAVAEQGVSDAKEKAKSWKDKKKNQNKE